jgi:hypothetical protein
LPLSLRVNLEVGAPGTTRTCDPLIRSQVLYPAELRVRGRQCKVSSFKFQVSPQSQFQVHFAKRPGEKLFEARRGIANLKPQT